MNYKKLIDWNSGFHDWTLRRHPTDRLKQNGFMGGFIFGERGQGKSTYAYKVMAKVYYTLNGYNTVNNEEDAYKEALRYMIYEPQDFQHLTIYNKLHNIVTPIICLDDASMHFGNMLHMINPKLYSSLMGQTATVRTAVTGFLLTAPKRSHVCKFLRDYDDFKGEALIENGGGQVDGEYQNWNRKIRFYKWRYYPDEIKYRIQIPFQDKYSCYIPDDHYLPYIKKKCYFEIKHDMQEADTISVDNRILFIEHKDILPTLDGYPDLKKLYIDRWEKELNVLKEEKLMKDIEKTIKKKRLEEKIKKINDIELNIEEKS